MDNATTPPPLGDELPRGALESGSSGHVDDINGSRFNHSFELIDSLGSGSFGTVFHVRAKTDGYHYAIKKIEFKAKAGKRKARSEVRLHSELSHRHVVRYFSSWSEAAEGKEVRSSPIQQNETLLPENGWVYLVMELCEGSLGTLLYKPNFTLEKMWSVMAQASDGLNYLHERGIIHGDIKPDNLLLKANKILLSDFGISHYYNPQSTKKGGFKYGTVPYMAPEVSDGLTPKCDMFSVGVMLFEAATKLLTGESFDELADTFDAAFRYMQLESTDSRRFTSQPKSWEKNQTVDEQTRAAIHSQILKLVNYDPDKRPNADEFYTSLLNDGFYTDSEENPRLQKQFAALKTHVDTKLENVDTQLKNVDTKLENVDTQLKKMGKSLQLISKKLFGDSGDDGLKDEDDGHKDEDDGEAKG